MFNIIISFIPWSIYSWVVNENVLTIVERSLILSVILLFIIVVNIKIVRQGEPVMITNILTVIILFVNYFVGWSTLLLNYPTSFCYLSLAFVSFMSLLVKKPFTIFYASAGVSEEKRRHIMFYLINKYITWIWTIIFLANGLLNAFFAWTPQLRLATIGLVCVGILFSKYLPNIMRYFYRVKHHGA
ncbi:hypothetical protein [Kosakonia oryzae]|jgi:hypothetical protein|uniref:Intracellular septation protein A n=1 Tax=Kosakonia oryzae TaxID=497725 RepID=A0AA94GZK3_9ENTR|nr:hypothetical protein [Kosakonia oryzae]ANI84321.1 hypothetical protein AWR26_19975 [Kosakonia oryzae]UDJ81436.1 hypothetical protein I5186_20085 [Kosakonia oryzae]SFB67757.1 hypothetical protein SAMN05216286_0218 [Kosakonia oryzae]